MTSSRQKYIDGTPLIAGSPRRCKDADEVGKGIGARIFVLAHVSHNQIVEYCHNDPDHPFPTFVVDTSGNCHKHNECDFDYSPEGNPQHKEFEVDTDEAMQMIRAHKHTSEDGSTLSDTEACALNRELNELKKKPGGNPQSLRIQVNNAGPESHLQEHQYLIQACKSIVFQTECDIDMVTNCSKQEEYGARKPKKT